MKTRLGVTETRGNAHVYFFIHVIIEKRCLYIHVMNLHVVRSGFDKEGYEGGHFHNESKSVSIVKAFDLNLAFGDHSGFVAGNHSIVLFEFVGPLASHNLSPWC